MIIDSRVRVEMSDAIWQMFSPDGIELLELTFKAPSIIEVKIVLKDRLDLRDRVVKVVKTDRNYVQELTVPDLREILRRVGLDKEE